MNWISVKERLPEDEEEVLVFADGKIHLMFYRRVLAVFEECSDESNVTHWMPLPEPPKEEEK